jgi:hypothetical protein
MPEKVQRVGFGMKRQRRRDETDIQLRQHGEQVRTVREYGGCELSGLRQEHLANRQGGAENLDTELVEDGSNTQLQHPLAEIRADIETEMLSDVRRQAVRVCSVGRRWVQGRGLQLIGREVGCPR